MEINIDQRVEKARQNFSAGYNCAQAVAMAYADIFVEDSSIVMTMASSFGGGMGRMREVCGAMSGAAMIAGFMRPATDLTDKSAKSANAALVQEFAHDFRSQTGSIICRELLGLDKSVVSKKIPCAELVALSARIVGEKLATL